MIFLLLVLGKEMSYLFDLNVKFIENRLTLINSQSNEY